MKIIWTPEAKADRGAIWDYIAQHDPDAAARMDGVFAEAIANLTDFPMLGHPGHVTGTRELIPHRRYRIVYEIFEDHVWVLAVVHTSRRWPAIS